MDKLLLSETVNLLKSTYKICITEDYEKIQENIFKAILNLSKIQENVNEKNTLVNGKSEEVKMFLNENNSNSLLFMLSEQDTNNNEYYFYPRDERQFKKEAYESGRVFVKAIHPDGKIETKIRKVSKVWSTTVYWNINSMYSDYILDDDEQKQHFSEGNNLKIYACPVAYKDNIPE